MEQGCHQLQSRRKKKRVTRGPVGLDVLDAICVRKAVVYLTQRSRVKKRHTLGRNLAQRKQRRMAAELGGG